MMSSGPIRGQVDANDVSPSGKLMLKYGPGRTIRRPVGTEKKTRGGDEEDIARGIWARGDEVVTGSINESSGEIVRWRENIGAANWTES